MFDVLPSEREGSKAGGERGVGEGVNIVLVPGLFAKNWTLQSLRERLESLGYSCFDAGFCTNYLVTGEYESLVRTLKRIGPAVVIGHSAGGLLAVRAAQEHPDLVTKVIGLGSAVAGVIGCPVPWLEARSLEGTLFPVSGPDEIKMFRGTFHALLPTTEEVQNWVVEKIEA